MEHMKHLLEDVQQEIHLSCITQHADVCLCRTMFTVSLYAYLHCCENVELPNDVNRYVANHMLSICFIMLFTLS